MLGLFYYVFSKVFVNVFINMKGEVVKNILSLFNGISALHLACDKAGFEINTCYYAEIDKYANKITEKHYPNDVALGDVTKWREWNIDWSSIYLVGAGFPCQAWSVAGKQLGDKDERGMLFWTTLEIIAHVLKNNPKAKFLMENVKMKKDFEQYITHHTEQALGRVEKTLINSALVSAQNRQRYYWTNFEVTQPDDKGILLKDVIESDADEKYNINPQALKRYTSELGKVKGFKDINDKSNCLTASMHKGFGNDGCTVVQKDNVVVFRPCELRENSKPADSGLWHVANATDIKGHEQRKRVYSGEGKAPTLQTCGGGNSEPKIYAEQLKYRKLTPIECERLQTFPDNWTDCVSNTQRYKALGNAWTVDVIVHILKCIH